MTTVHDNLLSCKFEKLIRVLTLVTLVKPRLFIKLMQIPIGELVLLIELMKCMFFCFQR